MSFRTRLVRYEEHTEMAWKNGAGRTREIAREDDSDGMLWRLSLATVAQSGPFSVFAGLDRIIVLIDGESMTLHFEDGETLALQPILPRRFSCERPLRGELPDSRPRRDLNLLFRRDAVEARAEAIRFSGDLHLGWDQVALAICFGVSGVTGIRQEPDTFDVIEPGDALFYDAGAGVDETRLSLSTQTAEAECLIFLISNPQRTGVS